MSLLDIENLSMSIGGTKILAGISLNVAPGEIVAITGESGAGKSMVALSTMGLLPDRARVTGRVILDGVNILTAPEATLCRQRGRVMGMVFQEPMTALNPVQTIGDQVAETIYIHKRLSKSAALDQARDMLNRVGLPEDLFPMNLYPHQLSGGQRQRVVIATAIALRPRLLIADEPTTALDVTTQALILDLLKNLTTEFGMGLLMITHDLAVVADMADRIIVMKHGSVVETGRTQTLLQDMQHPYTRALFAASAHRVRLPEISASVALLKVQNVTRTYRGPRNGLFGKRTNICAVNEVSFTIHRGERLGLVGESGCGKSTLTRALLGLEPVQSGSITFDGQPVWTDRHPNLDVRRQMQVVFQDPYGSFNPRHKVARLITEPFYLLPSQPSNDERTAKIAAALSDVGLKPTDATKYIHEFSGGQRQRIAIARALINDPALIIFDEAVSALDVSIRAQVLDLIADLCRKRPLSYLFISHDLSVVRTITDRVLVMQHGKIVEEGPTEDVLTTPRHSYTQRLIAAAPQLPYMRGTSHAQ